MLASAKRRRKRLVRLIAAAIAEDISFVEKVDFLVEFQPLSANRVARLKGQLTELKTKEEELEEKRRTAERRLIKSVRCNRML